MTIDGITSGASLQNTADKYGKLAKEQKKRERSGKQQQQLLQLQRH